MELFLAQNHSAMTHLPIGAAILAAVGAIAALFTPRKEVVYSWAMLSIVAFVTVLPAVATGVVSAKGRFNDEGKPYLESGLIVSNESPNARVRLHEMLGSSGSILSAILAILGTAFLRGKSPNKYVVVLLAVSLAVLWAIGGHLGGEEMWGPDTFPALK